MITGGFGFLVNQDRIRDKEFLTHGYHHNLIETYNRDNGDILHFFGVLYEGEIADFEESKKQQIILEFRKFFPEQVNACPMFYAINVEE